MLVTLQLHAGVYKWVDDKGRVHFSDRPVDGQSTQINIRQKSVDEASPGPEDRKSKMQRMLDVYQEERAERKEAKQKQQAERKQRKQNCVRAKDRYNSHLRASGIYDLNKDGERQYLSETQRARHMKRLKSEIARWCN
ncbi:MAG: DUF4124 domain-containing protein [Candidatus Thiodiazotropha sp.]